MLSIIYTTGRFDPKIEWFLESLERETAGDYTGIEIIVVDFFYGTPDRQPKCNIPPCLLHVPPKPNVWQGPHKLTQVDWFAVSNTRNTGLCYAHGDWVAFVDDLSFLMPGWLTEVRKAMAKGKRVMCGAYQKVKDLNIEGGKLIGFTDFPQGHDGRIGLASEDGTGSCPGSCMYGCSLAAPIEVFLSVNGYDERCNGLGFEDCITGIHVNKRGWMLTYNRNMMTLESEELHFVGHQMKRSDYGKSPADKSHKILELAQKGNGWSPNDFGEFSDLRRLRNHILAGGDFPKPRGPKVEWFTGTPLEQI